MYMRRVDGRKVTRLTPGDLASCPEGLAKLQAVQPHIDPTFSEYSYGFRPKRRAQDAVLQMKAYGVAGYA